MGPCTQIRRLWAKLWLSQTISSDLTCIKFSKREQGRPAANRRHAEVDADFAKGTAYSRLPCLNHQTVWQGRPHFALEAVRHSPQG